MKTTRKIVANPEIGSRNVVVGDYAKPGGVKTTSKTFVNLEIGSRNDVVEDYAKQG